MLGLEVIAGRQAFRSKTPAGSRQRFNDSVTLVMNFVTAEFAATCMSKQNGSTILLKRIAQFHTILTFHRKRLRPLQTRLPL